MKKIVSIILFSVALSFMGCSDNFFDINKNPNSATEENMTPNLILPRALHRVGDMTSTGNGVYERWMGYWTRSGTYGPNTDEEAYQITSSFNRGEWLTWYDILKDFDVIEKKAVDRKETAYIAIAKIMKSIGFMTLVDQYNNVPYSKSFDLENNLLTPYDKAEDIYADLLKQLEEADKLLSSATVAENFGLETADITFKGDLDMWRKLGNSQRLRLLIHESAILGSSGLKTEISKIVSNGAGFLGVGESANVQPGYIKDKNKQNPYWNSYKLDYAGSVVDNFNRANNYFLDLLMNGGDIRYKYFYSKAAKPISGQLYYGFDYGMIGDDENEAKAANSSDVAGPGIATGPDMAQWFFPSFESLFLQAEAVQRGALDGDAKEMYEAAVAESFAWLSIPDADKEAQAYLNPDVGDFAKWDSNADKLKLILTQKYIAMFGINGVETWTDYRRTGIPDVPLSIHPSRGSNHIPYRLVYPLEEYQYNKNNVLEQGEIDPQTMKIFWDK